MDKIERRATEAEAKAETVAVQAERAMANVTLEKNAESESLRDRLDDAERDLRTAREDAAETLRAVEATHAAALEALRAELASAKADARASAEALKASVSIRSLNHRFLDISIQAPRSLRPLEPEIRALAQSRLCRGRVELVVQARFLEEGTDVVVASRPLVAGLVRTLREIQSHHGLEGGVQVSDVVRVPGALEIETEGGVTEQRRGEVLQLVARALEGLEQMRRSEGENL